MKLSYRGIYRKNITSNRMLCFPLNNDVNEASKSEFPFMKCIVCRLYADKRYLIRSYLSFII